MPPSRNGGRTAATRWGVAATLCALTLAACGGGAADPVETATSTSPTDTGVEAAAPSPMPTADVAPTQGAVDGDGSTGDGSTGSASSSDDGAATDLAGTPIDFFFRDGDTLAVVGVAHDDVLNVRSGPGVDASIVSTLPPLSDDVVATGSTRELPSSFWTQVETAGATGWVNVRYVAFLGQTTDVTSEVVGAFDGERPSAGNMGALGRLVAESRASTDPPSDLVVVAPPTVGDLGEVTLDVIGVGDDAVVGLRLHVFGQPTADGFGLRTVEQTLLCGRGVAREDLCV